MRQVGDSRMLAEGLVHITGTMGSNVYIVDAKPPILIDAGFPADSFRVRRVLDNGPGLTPSLAIATHYHLDHVGSLWYLKKRYGLKVAAHRYDALVIEGKSPYEIYRLDLARSIYYTALSPVMFRYKHTLVEKKLSHGDALGAEGELEVIHVPGHTTGSIMLYDRRRMALFSGDCIRNENGAIEGPPPEFSTDFALARKMIRERVLELDFEMLLPGHGKPILTNACQLARTAFGKE